MSYSWTSLSLSFLDPETVLFLWILTKQLAAEHQQQCPVGWLQCSVRLSGAQW